jgi:pimeloyl-ACP methyl ester carboxylesterase
LDDSGAVKPTLVLSAVLCAGTLPAHAEVLLSDCRISAGPGYPGIPARCGVLERPENPSDPNSPLLALSVAVVPALSLDPEPDPFVPIAGGPGQSTIEFYSLLPHAFEQIRRTREIVLLDQRGTGESARLECDIGEELVEGQLSAEETIAATRNCLEALPHDPRFFTTSVAVEDLEAQRIALSYVQFNIDGASYGTRVAQHFARRFPASVRSLILDGVVPPQLSLGAGIAIEAQRALDNIFLRCAENPECGERFPETADSFRELEKQLASRAASVQLAHPVTGMHESLSFGDAEFAAAIRLMSYSPNTVALMPFLINEAARGNYAPLAAQFLMIADRMSDALAIGMHNAIVCTEDAPFYRDNDLDRTTLESTYIGPMQIDALKAICSVWPAGVLDPEFKTPLATNKPVLLLSGDADPVTPPAFGDLAAVDLTNATHLTGRHQGHGQAPTGCMPKVMARFVDTVSVAIEELDPDGCLARRFAMPFFLDFSGPKP